MKVVLFCGGLGLRLRDYSDQVPKPMVPIGPRPILWHVMKYFAHFGHRDFILCLGHRGDLIKQYFLNYSECTSNDFVFSDGGRTLNLFNNDIEDWRITFADTGLHSNIGQRLLAIEKYLGDDEVFLANYSDGLTDLNFSAYLEYATRQDKVATFVSVKPNLSYHITRIDNEGLVAGIDALASSDIWVNAGYFVLKRSIFSYFRPGEELVVEPFQRLIGEKQLSAYQYEGFFTAMDTFKDKQVLDNLYEKGNPPWEVWRGDGSQLQAERLIRGARRLENQIPVRAA
jgi:glucose-1-phosphate cytidylyltransferase